jgi:hypothetical protein
MSKNFRPIVNVIEPEQVIEGAGVRLRRAFGPSPENLFDPFLLFDHFYFDDPIEGPITGFPTHPHRGIETVTYMLEGNMRHRDSLGNTGVIGPEAVQWMTSGRGILHEEMPKRDASGKVNGFQLWVNLPAKLKMTTPSYQEVEAEQIPIGEQDGAKVRIVAGNYAGEEGAVTEIAAQPIYMDVRVEAGAEFKLDIAATHNAYAYLFEGQGEFGEGDEALQVEATRMLVFGEGDAIRAQSEKGMRFLLLAGAPFKEPVVPYGPFVMNTAAEIQQTFQDLRDGTFVDQSAI